MRWLLPKSTSGFKRHAEARQERSREALNQKFDESTGQIYIETTAAMQTSDDQGWERRSRVVVGPPYRDNELYEEHVKKWEKSKSPEDLGEYRKYLDGVKNSKVRRLKGARSLQDAAIECVLQNIADITLEGIECLPPQIVRRLWHAVNKRCTMSFNTWYIFSKILHKSETPTLDLLRYRQVIPEPKSPLPAYTTILTSQSFDFITSLTITVNIPIPDLIRISNIPNLGVLQIAKGPEVPSYVGRPQNFSQGVSDRVIRAWNQAIVNNGAFRILRVLKLWNHDEVTCDSLAFVSSFPALAIYDVRGCRFGASESKLQAQNLGWRLAPAMNILDQLDGLCKERAIMMQVQGFKSKSIQRPSSQPLWDEAKLKWIPRSEIPDFYLKAKLEVPTEPPHVSADADLPALKKSKKGHSKDRRREQQHSSSKVNAPKTWDFLTQTAFTRVGELRSDSDLARAGVPIGDQAVVGETLVNSVRMASLCLGPTDRISSTSPWGLIFLRIEAPSFVKLDTKASSVPKRGSSKEAFLKARQGPSVIKSKKRKLDDVLGSFF